MVQVLVPNLQATVQEYRTVAILCASIQKNMAKYAFRVNKAIFYEFLLLFLIFYSHTESKVRIRDSPGKT
jgi:hypothetical protein